MSTTSKWDNYPLRVTSAHLIREVEGSTTAAAGGARNELGRVCCASVGRGDGGGSASA